MAFRDANKSLSAQNEAIIANGSYLTSSGQRVDLAASVAASCAGVCSYTEADTAALLQQQSPTPGSSFPRYNTRFEVTNEASSAAGARLHSQLSSSPSTSTSTTASTSTTPPPAPAVLNFASARNPGGGYLNGARAQEEDVCRTSALYTTLLRAPDYYASHRASRDGRYSHRIIWSPNVPVYRSSSTRALLDTPYPISFITSPAPNAGAVAHHAPQNVASCAAVLRERAARILAVAATHGVTHIVLGAWGCGVFRNDPATVADAWKTLLGPGGRFEGRFDTVVMAIYDRSKSQETMRAFKLAFPKGADTVHRDF